MTTVDMMLIQRPSRATSCQNTKIGFTVQGIIINGTYRVLPTLIIASESNLTLLIFTLQILSAASGVDAKVLVEIDFVISDQTAPNVDVEVLVSRELGMHNASTQLLSISVTKRVILTSLL